MNITSVGTSVGSKSSSGGGTPRSLWGGLFVLVGTFFLIGVFTTVDIGGKKKSPERISIPEKPKIAYRVITGNFDVLKIRPGDGYVISITTAWSGLIDAGSGYPGSWYLPLTNCDADLLFEGQEEPIRLPAYTEARLGGPRPGRFRLKSFSGEGRALVRVSWKNKWEDYDF